MGQWLWAIYRTLLSLGRAVAPLLLAHGTRGAAWLTRPRICRYDFAISINLDEVKAEDKEKVLRDVASMRRHLLSAPITKALQGIKDGNGGMCTPS